MIDDNELFWAGSKRAWIQSDYLVSRMQASDGKLWLEDDSGLRLDPNYSDYSVRVYHPNSRTLSFILSTVAIIPKSLAKRVHALLGEYLYGDDKPTDDKCCQTCEHWVENLTGPVAEDDGCKTNGNEYCRNWSGDSYGPPTECCECIQPCVIKPVVGGCPGFERGD